MRSRATHWVMALFTTVAVLAVAAVPSAAQSTVDVRIREAELGEEGATRLVVSVTGAAVEDGVLDPEAFSVSENGEAVGAATVEPILEAAEPTPVTIALLVDTSGSTKGEPLEQTRTAAVDFVRTAAADGIRMGLVAFGPEVEVPVRPTTDGDALATAIGELQAAGETPLYDALVEGAALVEGRDGLRELVVFSDGGDTVSERSLDDAVAAVQAVEAPVSAVALETPELDREALERLVSATDGRLLPAEDPAVLADAFDRVAKEVASQYVITYEGAIADPDELDIAVTVDVGAASGTDRATVANPRLTSAPLPDAPAPLDPVIEPLASETGLWIGVAAAFLALIVLLGMFLVSPVRRRGERALERSLGQAAGTDGSPESSESNELLSRAADLVERLPSDDERTSALQSKLERAGWALRSGEFRVFELGGPVLGLALGWGLLASPMLGIALALVGALVPRALLSRRVGRRTRAFDRQLPDVLQMVAGSLRAGYGLLQAIGTVAEEAEEPAREEFGRVMNEARLGGSLSDALDAMAERVGSEDFRWAVIAINIQRRVGGNLAELLDTIADTVREREEIRREVRSLSAEGRLSAWILTVLPVLVAGYIAVVNPDYLSVLVESPGGLVAVLGALLLMGAGVFWIRRVVRIQV